MPIAATRYHGAAHVTADGLLPAAEHCPWCGAAQRRRIVRLQADPDVWLTGCAHCHAASADRMPTEARLAAYYAHYYDVAEGAHVTVARPDAAAAHIARHVAPAGPRALLRLLDFGGGDGSLGIGVARRLVDRGQAARAEVDVVDYAAAGIAREAEALRVRGHASLAELPEDARYDVILASAILEHLPAPLPVYTGLCERLEAGGRLYARTPWMAPLMRLLAPFGIRLDFTYPGHVHDLGGDFWSRAHRLPGVPADLRVVHSATSFVETRLAEDPLRTLAAHALKLPARLLGARWPYVGGWEAVLARG